MGEAAPTASIVDWAEHSQSGDAMFRETCKEDAVVPAAMVATSTDAATKFAVPLKTMNERVVGLAAWPNDLNLSEYYDAACTWCTDMGAIYLDEIHENIDDFACHLKLKPLERRRL